MNIFIDYQSRVPIYEQIVDGIEKLVLLNILKPDEQIPSIRDLACSLGVNPNTIKKAYDILETKGIIISKSTKGSFIAPDTDKAKQDRISSLLKDIEEKMAELKKYGYSKDDILKKLK